MSTNSNDELLERARYVQNEYPGTYLVEAIDNLIEQNELERLDYMLREAEYELAIRDHHAEGPDNDTY